MHAVHSRRPAIRLTALIGVVVGSITFSTAAGAQLPRPRPEVNVKLPELEIYQIKPQNDPVRITSPVVIAIGVRNNGNASGAFNYAIGPKDRSAVWATGKASTVAAGKVAIGGIRLDYREADNFFRKALGAPPRRPTETVCFGVFLVRSNSTELYVDSNPANHQKEQCLRFEFQIS